MNRFFQAYGRFVARKPWLAVGLVAAITGVAIFGLGLTEDTDTNAFLPEDSELARAQVALDESFPESAGLEGVQIIFRGDVLTPEGLSTTRLVTNAALNDPDIGPFVDRSSEVLSPGHIVAALFGDPAVELASLTQDQINTTLDDAIEQEEAAALLAALESTTGRDADGTVIGGIGVFTVNAGGDAQALQDAQVAFEETVDALDLGAIDARTFSSGKSSRASQESSSSSILVLMLIALLVIALLLAVFYRAAADVAVSMIGLVLTILWALGFQGLLGPRGIGFIGAPSDLATLVPVMMIGLCVDYGIQGVSRYRESLTNGDDPTEAMSNAVSSLLLPLGLAGGTTIISFLTNLLGDIPGLADFGVIAAAGVASGLFIFLTLNPALKVLSDRRAVAAKKKPKSTLIGDAIPGAGALIERVGVAAVRKPAAILIGVGVITLVLGGFAIRLESSFNNSDFLPNGSEPSEDLEFLSTSLGGKTEPVTVVIEGDLSNDRTLRNLIEFEDALNDPIRRPAAISGQVTESLGVLARSIDDEAQAQIAQLFVNNDSPLFLPESDIDAAVAIIESADPQRFAQLVTLGGGESQDRMVLKFNAVTGNSDQTRDLVSGLDQLWFGDPAALTPISAEITGLEVSDSLTSSQATAIAYTIIAALIVLVLYFGLVDFRPMLGVIAVVPILLVLIWVLGTMTIIGYDYNVVTAIITALSIGIGVDYTIHVVHRFTEEFAETGALVEAMATTMRTTGSALVGSAFTTALGFLVLLFSPLTPFGQFGVLTTITVIYALIAAVVVLPPMLVIWAAYHSWRQTSLDRPAQHATRSPAARQTT